MNWLFFEATDKRGNVCNTLDHPLFLSCFDAFDRKAPTFRSYFRKGNIDGLTKYSHSRVPWPFIKQKQVIFEFTTLSNFTK